SRRPSSATPAFTRGCEGARRAPLRDVRKDRGMSVNEIATAAGAAAMAAIREDPGGTLLALDFDGTLAPIVDDPDQARADREAVHALGRLGPVFRRIAIVTGRPASAALRLGGFDRVPGLETMTIL